MATRHARCDGVRVTTPALTCERAGSDRPTLGLVLARLAAGRCEIGDRAGGCRNETEAGTTNAPAVHGGKERDP
jgi:hypothetical protein